MIKYLVVAALIVTAIIFAWLHWWVMPTKVVATVQPIPIGARLNGAVFGKVSSSSDGKKTTMLLHDRVSNGWWQITEFERGWSALYSWLPIGIALFAGGIWVGFGSGVMLADDKHGRAAAETLQRGEAALIEARQRMQQASDNTKTAEYAQQEALRSIRTAEHRATLAEKRAVEAETETAEAGRKLENERIKHKEELDKAGARIAGLKAKTKKN